MIATGCLANASWYPEPGAALALPNPPLAAYQPQISPRQHARDSTRAVLPCGWPLMPRAAQPEHCLYLTGDTSLKPRLVFKTTAPWLQSSQTLCGGRRTRPIADLVEVQACTAGIPGLPNKPKQRNLAATQAVYSIKSGCTSTVSRLLTLTPITRIANPQGLSTVCMHPTRKIHGC